MIPNLCFVFVLLVSSHLCTSTPIAETDKNVPKIICHYHLHTWYAPDFRDYSPEVIDESLCTHIVYNDRVRYTDLSANRSLHDGKTLFYSRIPEFRKKGINVSISFFKFNAYEYARAVADNATERDRFVMSLVGFMEQNNFNGFDVFWICKPCSKGDLRDAHQDQVFIDFVRQLSEAFKPRGWLLSTFVSVNKDVVHDAFDIQKLSEYFDWMTVMSINKSKNSTALSLPLYYNEGDPNQDLTANWTINYLIEKGVSSLKIVLPASSVGKTFQLESPQDHGLNAPSDQKFSDNFNEICVKIINDNWTVVHDKRVGSYAFYDDQWTSYEDVADVQRRAEYIIKNNLGGGSLSNLNYDDFEGKCGCGKSPLMKALSQALRNAAGPKSNNCT